MMAARRKFQVAVKPIMLKISNSVDADDGEIQSRKYVSLRMKWKGELGSSKFSQIFQRRRDFSSERLLLQQVVRWDDGDRWFQHTCRFSAAAPWDLEFSILYGNSKSATKLCVIGSVAVNIAEIAGKTEKCLMEQTVHVSLKIDGVGKDAFLTILFNFIEIRVPQESTTILRQVGYEHDKNEKTRRRSLSQDESSLGVALEQKYIFRKSRSVISSNPLDSDKKEGWFSWRNKRFMSFKRAKTNEGALDKITENCSNQNMMNADIVSGSLDNGDRVQKGTPVNPSSYIEDQHDENTAGSWEENVFISRDGKTRLKTNVYFASFDQRSDKAVGESACTALVAVIADWFHSNLDAMPSRLEFDNLIIQGSSAWRKLCENVDYTNDFPNKHFDLETVLSAGIRPISILQEKSYVGFFGAEKFESLKETMSFDKIWKQISGNIAVNNSAPCIYIVSWNDHFFVLKAELNAYYMIDTLGERLFEGCNQAYILKFDESSMIEVMGDDEIPEQAKTEAETAESTNGDIIEMENVKQSGKECCGEFIKRFLAAIPLKELEEEEKKMAASYFSLHHRLQIEFSYSCWSLSNPPSTMSSLFSSPDTLSSPLPN